MHYIYNMYISNADFGMDFTFFGIKKVLKKYGKIWNLCM